MKPKTSRTSEVYGHGLRCLEWRAGTTPPPEDEKGV